MKILNFLLIYIKTSCHDKNVKKSFKLSIFFKMSYFKLLLFKEEFAENIQQYGRAKCGIFVCGFGGIYLSKDV